MRSLTFLCLILFCPYLQGQMEAFGKYFQGHSHNDYAQEFPLTTALEKGFSSIEIDVFAHKGQIVVAHDPEDLYLKPSIQELYLEPLFSKERKFKHLILLVDIKICTDNLLELLETSLLPFADHLVSLDDATGKSVQIVLSGDVPKQALLQTKDYPYFFIDGRASDLGQTVLHERIVMISAKFSELTSWKGDKRATRSSIKSVIELVEKAKKAGRKIRFWDTKDTEETWKLLLALDVDIIGVDDLDSLDHFVKTY